jgi:hypothetical protein
MSMPVDDGQGAATGLAPGADALSEPPPTVGSRGARALAAAFALLATRAHEAAAFLLTGGLCVVAGGFVAALAGPLDLALGSWAAAYLVLVAGVVQIALGGVQVAVTPRRPGRRTLIAEYLSFNAGNALVIAGTLLAAPAVVDAGGAVLVVALALFLNAARGARPGWAVRLYDLVLAIVLASIPVGLLLSHLRG